jgi:phosphoribosylformylglycinamidine synthase
VVLLVGPVGMDLGGSEYQRLAHGVNAGPRPTLDLDLEARVQAVVLEAIGSGWLRSCHDLAEGGLGVALAESCILGGRGVHVTAPFFSLGSPIVQSGLLFGESQSRFLVSAAPADVAALRAVAQSRDVEVRELGVTGGGRVVVDGVLALELKALQEAYDGALLAPATGT